MIQAVYWTRIGRHVFFFRAFSGSFVRFGEALMFRLMRATEENRGGGNLYGTETR